MLKHVLALPGQILCRNARTITVDGTVMGDGKKLEIPIHPALQAALAAVHPRHEQAILASKAGQAPLNPIYFGHLMAAAIEEAELPDDCVLHGLRKAAVVALIDAGCTPFQAAAISGHRTMRMLEHYAKERDQVKLGQAAMLKWGKAKNES
jgi:integrase